MYLVIGKPECIYCKNSLILLNFKNQNYMFLDLNENSNHKYKKYIPKRYKYVPQILNIHKNKVTFIGGYNELKNKLQIGGKNKTKKKTVIGRCSPKYNLTKHKTGTCYDKSALIELINTYNLTNKENKITFKKTESVNSLWNKLNSKLNTKCSDEACWSEVTNNMSLLKKHFIPKKPNSWKNSPNEWLSTIDIENVLKQYEHKYNDFKFLGCVPVDFDTRLMPGVCVDKTLCSFELKDYLNKNINRMGAVYNLDKHDEPGSHWVASYIDHNKKHVYYFDSVGDKPPSEIDNFSKKIVTQAKDLGYNYKYIINNKGHQKKNTECGVYCINFLINMLENGDFFKHINNYMPDDLMAENRDKYFA